MLRKLKLKKLTPDYINELEKTTGNIRVGQDNASVSR